MSSKEQIKQYNRRLLNQANNLKAENERLKKENYEANRAAAGFQKRLWKAESRRYFWEFWLIKYYI